MQHSPRRYALSVSSPCKWSALLVWRSLLSVSTATWPDAPRRHGATANREVVVGTGLRRGSHSPHGGHHRQLLLRGAPRRPIPETRHIVAIVRQLWCCLVPTTPGGRCMKQTSSMYCAPTDNATISTEHLLFFQHDRQKAAFALTPTVASSEKYHVISVCYNAFSFTIITHNISRRNLGFQLF
jgi:hypothetical protein